MGFHGCFVGAAGRFVGTTVGRFVGTAVGRMFGATDGVTLGFAVGVFVGELVGVALGFGRTDSASINRSTEYPLFAISIIPYKTGYLFFPCIQVKYLLPAAFCAVTKLFNAVRSETVYA